jgi:hypothetical protein
MLPPGMPAPKFHTLRDPSRPTLGKLQGHFAKIWLGHSLMPAQQLIADVSGELRPDGLPRYPLVIVTEPRQAGKSHLAMAQIGERCFTKPGYRAWYTAQTGQDARDQFIKFDEEVVRGTPLDSVTNTLIGAGREVMKFPGQSTLRPHPPSEEKLHGKQSDRNDIDEAWAFSLEEGRALMQAIGPTQLTRPGAQTFIWSAGGTAQSTWLAELVARGRAGDPEICYFEWGIPDDADPEDLDVIAANHPAYGHTITMDSLRGLRSLFKGDPSGWARAAGNRWTEIIGGAIAWANWTAHRSGLTIPDTATEIGYGAARAADGSEVALVAAAKVDGQIIVQMLGTYPDPTMAAGLIAGALSWDDAIAVDPVGPSSSLHAGLDRLGVNLLPVGSRDVSAAVDDLLDSLKSPAGRIKFVESADLDNSAKIAGTRSMGDGGKAWARVGSGASIAPIEAATLAVSALGRKTPLDLSGPTLYIPGEA